MTVSLLVKEFSTCGMFHGRSIKKLSLGPSAIYCFWKDIVYPQLQQLDQMLAIIVSLFKKLSAPTIMYDKYCDGAGWDAMLSLVGSPECPLSGAGGQVRKGPLEDRIGKPRLDN